MIKNYFRLFSITILCSCLLLFSACDEDLTLAYSHGIPAKEGYHSSDVSYEVLNNCFDIKVTDGRGTRTWNTGITTGKLLYPYCGSARFSANGNYLFVPYVSSCLIECAADSVELIIVDLRREMKVGAVDVSGKDLK